MTFRIIFKMTLGMAWIYVALYILGGMQAVTIGSAIGLIIAGILSITSALMEIK